MNCPFFNILPGKACQFSGSLSPLTARDTYTDHKTRMQKNTGRDGVLLRGRRLGGQQSIGDNKGETARCRIFEINSLIDIRQNKTKEVDHGLQFRRRDIRGCYFMASVIAQITLETGSIMGCVSVDSVYSLRSYNLPGRDNHGGPAVNIEDPAGCRSCDNPHCDNCEYFNHEIHQAIEQINIGDNK
jgi:hypothetical protein